MRSFGLVAVGGTFDHLHRGHRQFLFRAFDLGETVIVGIASDGLAKSAGKVGIQDVNQRVGQVKALLIVKGLLSRARIIVLEDPFGPAASDPGIEAIVVTPGTAARAYEANRIRAERGIQPMNVEVVALVPAEDGRPISSTRIRNREIDEEGKLLKAHPK